MKRKNVKVWFVIRLTYGDVEIELEEGVGEPGGSIDEVGEWEKEWHVFHALGLDHLFLHKTCYINNVVKPININVVFRRGLMDIYTYHDGEGGGIHKNSEDDAENSNKVGSCSMSVEFHQCDHGNGSNESHFQAKPADYFQLQIMCLDMYNNQQHTFQTKRNPNRSKR